MNHAKKYNDNTNDIKLALLEQSVIHINETLKELKDEMKEFRKEMKEFRQEMNEKIDKEVKYIANRSWLQFLFLFAMISTVLGIMAHGFKWF